MSLSSIQAPNKDAYNLTWTVTVPSLSSLFSLISPLDWTKLKFNQTLSLFFGKEPNPMPVAKNFSEMDHGIFLENVERTEKQVLRSILDT